MSNEVRGVEVVGDVKTVVRKETGLWSFDRALGFRGNNGVPLRSLFELYGAEHSGKSTLAWFLAAQVKSEGIVWIADLEGTLDPIYAQAVVENAGMVLGTVRVADYIKITKGKKGMVSHEKQVQDAIDALLDPDVNASVIDSIGMFYSELARSKDLGERTVGDRAKVVGDASRRLSCWLRIEDEPKLILFVNHVHPNIGGRGFDTPGGETKKFAANVRVWLRRIENDVPEGSGNFLAEARVQKNKFGGAHSGSRGLVYFIPGFGVSREMTAVFDCIRLGLAKREATVKLELMDSKDQKFKWTSMGRIGTLAGKALEPKKNKAAFRPFFEKLEEVEG